jgi:hypothetical protein
MTRRIEILHDGQVSRFTMRPLERKTLYGCTRRIALDADGHECATALRTRDGCYLLPSGSTAELYLDAQGDVLERRELLASSNTMRIGNGGAAPLPAKTVSADVFLDHVAVRVHLLSTETVAPRLEAELQRGVILQLPDVADGFARALFLLANEHGLFLIQAEPCGWQFVGLAQAVEETGDEWLEETEALEDEAFGFGLEREADHVLA